MRSVQDHLQLGLTACKTSQTSIARRWWTQLRRQAAKHTETLRSEAFASGPSHSFKMWCATGSARHTTPLKFAQVHST